MSDLDNMTEFELQESKIDCELLIYRLQNQKRVQYLRLSKIKELIRKQFIPKPIKVMTHTEIEKALGHEVIIKEDS